MTNQKTDPKPVTYDAKTEIAPGPWEMQTKSYEKCHKGREGRSFMGEIIAADGSIVYAGPYAFHSLIGLPNAILFTSARTLLETLEDMVDLIEEMFPLDEETGLDPMPSRYKNRIELAKRVTNKARGFSEDE